MTIKLHRKNLPKAILLTYTVLVFVVLLFVQANVVSVNHIYAADNNCCGYSDYRNGATCMTREDWDAGYWACQNHQCSQCPADGTPNDGYCGPGENENDPTNTDCTKGDPNNNGAGAGESTGIPTSGGGTATGGTATNIETNCVHGKVYCKKDYPQLAYNMANGIPLVSNSFRAEQIGRICYNGVLNPTATIFDACAPQIQANTSCAGVIRRSVGEAGTYGGFVGCNGTLNCFCGPADCNPSTRSDGMFTCTSGVETQVGSTYTGDYTVRCYEDTVLAGLGYADSCGGRAAVTTPVVTTPVNNVGDTPETPYTPPEQPKTYACEVMTNTKGIFTIKSGDTLDYLVTYKSDYDNAPYAQNAVKLLLSENGSVATSVQLIDADSLTSSVVGSVHYYYYYFNWTSGVLNNGTYQVHFLTNGTDSGKVTSPITCAQTLNVTSEDIPEDVPGLEVTKLLLTGDRSYISGEKAVFSVRIKNTGETTFTNVMYQDRFWSQYLSFTGVIRGRKTGVNTWKDLAPVAVVNKSTGQVDISNLASSSALGALAPNQEYEIQMDFLTKSPVQWTCNQIYITANDLPGYDDACLGIVPPNTDM